MDDRSVSRPGARGRLVFKIAAGLLGASLVAGACGSTLDESALNAQFDNGPVSTAPQNHAAESEAANTGSAQGSAPAAGSPAAVASGSPSAPSQAVTGSQATTSAQSQAPTKQAGTSTGTPKATGKAAPAKPGSGAAPKPAVAGAPVAPAGPKSEIVLGSYGIESGVIGTATLPIHQAVRAWVADVNARGGLNGHPVRLVMADDEGDPNKALSLVRRMVEQDGAVAIFGEHACTTAQAVLPYLEQRKVPSISPAFCAGANARSPMGFQVGFGADYGVAWAHMLPIPAYTDKRKASLFYCREAPVCQAIRNRVQELKSAIGLQVVHEAQVSLAQPDYTAEVLAARNAGADIVISIVEDPSTVRIARSIARQGWRPLLVTQGSAHNERLLRDGGSDVENLVVGATLPVWDSPKLADYVGALGRFVPGGIKSSMGEYVWAGGKLMEKFAPALPDKPTSADFLRGLYSFNGETLGGLIPPLTYREGEPHDKSNLCAIPVQVQARKFIAKNGDNYLCAPGWKPLTK